MINSKYTYSYQIEISKTVTYSYACRNIVNTIMTGGDTSLEKTYLSHFIQNGTKGLRKGYVWEVSWRLNKTAIYWPPPSSSGHSSPSLSFSWAAQPGTLRAQLSAGFGSHCFELQQLTPKSDLQLTRTSCSNRLYNCLTSTCFSERRICTHSTRPQSRLSPWYLRPDAPVIYTGAFLIWQLGRVGGQYVTKPYNCEQKMSTGSFKNVMYKKCLEIVY